MVITHNKWTLWKSNGNRSRKKIFDRYTIKVKIKKKFIISIQKINFTRIHLWFDIRAHKIQAVKEKNLLILLILMIFCKTVVGYEIGVKFLF